jgi:hypothetical protein
MAEIHWVTGVVRCVVGNGTWLMSKRYGSGPDRNTEALQLAVSYPLGSVA